MIPELNLWLLIEDAITWARHGEPDTQLGQPNLPDEPIPDSISVPSSHITTQCSPPERNADVSITLIPSCFSSTDTPVEHIRDHS